MPTLYTEKDAMLNQEKRNAGFVAALVFDDYEYSSELYRQCKIALKKNGKIRYKGIDYPVAAIDIAEESTLFGLKGNNGKSNI